MSSPSVTLESIGRAFFLRKVSLALAFVAAFLLSAAYIKSNYINGVLGVSGSAAALLATLVVIIHLVYLWIVNSISVLNKPIDRLTKRDLVLPALLGLAYSLYALSILLRWVWLGVFALFVMVVLYSWWMRIDFLEMKTKYTNYGKLERWFWIFVDFISAAVLVALVLDCLWYLAHRDISWVGDAPPNSKLWKDTVILFCVGVFVLAHVVGRFWRDHPHYVNVYSDYLRHVSGMKVLPLSSDAGDVLSSLPRRFTTSINVLDFGCGSGSRGVELLDSLGFDLSSIENYVGMDCNGAWSGTFIENAGKLLAGDVDFQDSNSFRTSKWNRPGSFQLIIMSHVFYDSEIQHGKNDAGSLLAPDGAFLVRGAAANSIFGMAARFRAQNITAPSFDAFWITKFLRPWIIKTKLAPLAGEDVEPTARLASSYPISSEPAVKALGNFISFLYGDAARAYIENFIADSRSAGVQDVPNDDLLFAFEFPRRPS